MCHSELLRGMDVSEFNPNIPEKFLYKPKDGTASYIEIPLFFGTTNKEKARAQREAGADYSLRGGVDNGTVLHHFCRMGFREPSAIELLQFYLAHGAAVNAVDAKGRTPLHILGQQVATIGHENAIAYAVMLCAHRADPRARDVTGATCTDYAGHNKYVPSPGHFERNVFSSFMRAYLSDATPKMPFKAALYYGFGSCTCHTRIAEETLNKRPVSITERKGVKSVYVRGKAPQTKVVAITPAYIKEWKPILPEPRLALNCNELRKHRKYPFWQRIVAIQDSSEFHEGAGDVLLDEFAPVFSAWKQVRVLIAMVLAIDKNYFNEDFNDYEFGTLALLEDDVELIKYLLEHGVRKINSTYWAQSLAMAKLLATYSEKLVDPTGGNVLHHLSRFGVLCDPDVFLYYLQQFNPHLENKEGQTPLDELVQYSYRYARHGKKLIEYARMLLLAGADPCRIQRKTKKSAIAAAHDVHDLWKLAVTGALVRLLTVATDEPQTNGGIFGFIFGNKERTMEEKRAAIVKEASSILREL